MRAFRLLLLVLIAAFVAPTYARELPPLRGHVVDTSGELSAEDIAYLDAALERDRAELGVPVVVFVVGSLDGEPIEDVAYDAFNEWGVGDAQRDDGVLLVIAPDERRVRIETGKGIGDRLTDLESSEIIANTIAPLLAERRIRSAIQQGAQAIAQSATFGAVPPAPPPTAPSAWMYIGLAVMILVVLGLAIASPAFRGLLFFGFLFGGPRGGSGGGGRSNFTGGGGSSGGGGASGDY